MTGPVTTEKAGGRGVGRGVGRPRNEQVDEAVLDAALALLADGGYQAFSMETVAARAGVAKTTVYRRWPGKDELIMDALVLMKGEVPVPPGGTFRDDLRFMIHAMREQWWSGRHGRLMQRLAADGIEHPAHYNEFRTRLLAPRQARMFAILQRGVDEGAIAPDVDLTWALQLITSPVVAAGLGHQGPISPEQIDFIVDTVLDGLAAGATRSTSAPRGTEQ